MSSNNRDLKSPVMKKNVKIIETGQSEDLELNPYYLSNITEKDSHKKNNPKRLKSRKSLLPQLSLYDQADQNSKMLEYYINKTGLKVADFDPHD